MRFRWHVIPATLLCAAWAGHIVAILLPATDRFFSGRALGEVPLLGYEALVGLPIVYLMRGDLIAHVLTVGLFFAQLYTLIVPIPVLAFPRLAHWHVAPLFCIGVYPVVLGFLSRTNTLYGVYIWSLCVTTMGLMCFILRLAARRNVVE